MAGRTPWLVAIHAPSDRPVLTRTATARLSALSADLLAMFLTIAEQPARRLAAVHVQHTIGADHDAAREQRADTAPLADDAVVRP